MYSIVLFFYYEKSQESAILQAQLEAEDLLRNIKATKMFYNEKSIAKFRTLYKNVNLNEKKISPELYSCTYATKQINTYYNELRANKNLPTIDISYVAKNPKNINNQPFGEESKLLNDFNKGTLASYKKIIDTKKGKYLYFAQPVEKIKERCLTCHGKPQNAPKILIEKYGYAQGFYHKIGETSAFIKILIPLETYLERTNKLFWTIGFTSFIIILLVIILVKLSVEKNKQQSNQFQKVLDTLDEIIILKSNTKVHAVSKSFLNFFGMKNFKQFTKHHNCISDAFIKGDNFIDINLNEDANKFIKKLKKTEKSKRIVQMKNKDGELHILSIKIDKLEENEDLYVIILSDITKLQQRTEKFKKRANIDALTQVFSRQKFNSLYEVEFSRSIRYINPLTILFIDIDHFKEINDTYGHDIGDLSLKTFASIISNNIRKNDVFARWGGEEFILMLPQTDVNDGYKLAEKIRKAIFTHNFEGINTLTCSIGLSMLNKGDNSEIIIKRADTALYKAKNGGRNRTIIEI